MSWAVNKLRTTRKEALDLVFKTKLYTVSNAAEDALRIKALDLVEAAIKAQPEGTLINVEASGSFNAQKQFLSLKVSAE